MAAFRWGLGSLSLDLLATRGVRERLTAPQDLDRWLADGGFGVTVRATEADLDAARALREAIRNLVANALAARGPGTRDRQLVNDHAARHPDTPRIGVGWQRVDAPSGTPTAALSRVARSAIDLLTGPDVGRIRRCDGCTLLFVDRSRPGTRRWCAMEVCGNRRKAAAHRDRARSAAGSE